MREILANLDTFYVINYVLLMMKWIYCHMYQGDSQGIVWRSQTLGVSAHAVMCRLYWKR